jgi:hypothetical protein
MFSAAAAQVQANNLEWILPIPQQQLTDAKVTQQQEEASSAIPIVVMNGLCDCAAQIRRLGGNEKAIYMGKRAGLLRCAAIDENYGTVDSPFMDEFESMKTIIDSGEKSSNREWLEGSHHIQFWKTTTSLTATESEGNTTLFDPMSPRLSFQTDDACTSSLTTSTATPPIQSVNSYSNDANLTAIESAVIMSVKAGCDVCIVVTHREEIRDICKHACHYHHHHHRLSIPYCCIGRFEVDADFQPPNPSLEWTLHGLSDPEDFDAALVPPLTAPTLYYVLA